MEVQLSARARLVRAQGPVLRFEIPMKPVPKERPRMGRGSRVYTPERTRAFEVAAGWYALQARQRAGWEALSEPLLLDVVFHGAPKGADLSNLTKALEDAMNGIIYHDDSQIVGEAVWALPDTRPYIQVEVVPLGGGSDGNSGQ